MITKWISGHETLTRFFFWVVLQQHLLYFICYHNATCCHFRFTITDRFKYVVLSKESIEKPVTLIIFVLLHNYSLCIVICLLGNKNKLLIILISLVLWLWWTSKAPKLANLFDVVCSDYILVDLI